MGQHELGGIQRIIGRLHELDEPRLAATAGIHLRFDNTYRLGELLERQCGFIRRSAHLRRRNRNAIFGKDLTGLVFVDLHS